MATISFDLNLVIHNEEEAQRLIDALEEAERSGPEEYHDFSEELRRGELFVQRRKKQ